MSLKLEDLTNAVGAYINQLTDGTFVDGRVTRPMVHTAIQNRYDELASELANQYPSDFQVHKKIDVGPTHEDDAAGEGVYFLDGIDVNILTINQVRAKTTSADSSYYRVDYKKYEDLLEYGDETYSAMDRKYTYRTLASGSVYKRALQFFPRFDNDITSGAYIVFVPRLSQLSESIDVSDAIPLTHQWIIAEGAMIDIMKMLGGNWLKQLDGQRSEWEMLKAKCIASYNPVAADEPQIIRSSSWAQKMRERVI